MQPGPEIVADLREKFPGRVMRLVELVDGDEAQAFIVTGPTAIDFKKFTREVLEARGDGERLRSAVESAALAQIRWPERAEVKRLFDLHPAWPDHFADLLHRMAGANAELREKNL